MKHAPLAMVLLCFAAASPAQEALPVKAEVLMLDGNRLAGTLAGFANRQVRLMPAAPNAGDAPYKMLPVDDLLSIEFSDATTAAVPSAVLEFANGDRLAVEVVATDGDQLTVRWQGIPLAVPLAELRGLAFRAIDVENGPAGLMFRESGEDDLVLLTNGDHLAGHFVELTADELVLETEARELRVPRDRVTAVAFSPELIAATRSDTARQIVETNAGSLTVQDLTLRDDGSWQAETLFGEGVTFPLESLRRVLFAGGRAALLSEIEPSAVEFTPFLSRVWPIRRDRAVTGEPLSVSGRNYAKGLGVHSRCRARYDLNGEYAVFHAVAGLAESAGDVGSVEFIVEVDGREVLRTGPVTGKDPPVQIENLDLSGAKSLVLTVDFARNGNIRDRANWCDAVLVRK